MARRIILTTTIVLILSMTMLLGVVNADGEGKSPVDSSDDTVTAPLIVDCSQVQDTPTAHAILASQNLCGFGSSGQDVVQDGTVSGDCGLLTLRLIDLGGAKVRWRIIITSVLGTMVETNYKGRLSNLTHGTGALVSGGASNLSTIVWEDDQDIQIGAGWVFGEVTSASTVLSSGVGCTAAGFPTDTVAVTSW